MSGTVNRNHSLKHSQRSVCLWSALAVLGLVSVCEEGIQTPGQRTRRVGALVQPRLMTPIAR